MSTGAVDAGEIPLQPVELKVDDSRDVNPIPLAVWNTLPAYQRRIMREVATRVRLNVERALNHHPDARVSPSPRRPNTHASRL